MLQSKAKSPTTRWRRIRRITQLAILAFFIILFVDARFRESNPNIVNPLSNLFLELDPLISICASISTRDIAAFASVSIIVIIATIFFGRIFCGWVCPLGTIIDITRHLVFWRPGAPWRQRRSRKHLIANQDKRLPKLRKIKYYVLIFLVVSCLFSSLFVGFIDPISLLTRTFASVIFPLITLLRDAVSTPLSAGPNETLQAIGNFIYQKTEVFLGPPLAAQTFFIALVLITILVLEYFTARFWCRYLCPLGALLALLSRYRILKRELTQECGDCDLCIKQCRMGAIPQDDAGKTDTGECIVCCNCIAVCRFGPIRYTVGRPDATGSAIDLRRREFVFSGAFGLVFAGLSGVRYQDEEQKGRILRPPGVLKEDDFLDRCIRCGECIRVCSTTGRGLQSAFLEAGWYGLWSPIFKFRSGYCSYDCSLCIQICPAGAIRPLTLDEKKKFVIGIACIDRSRCYPWYLNENCIVCEEICPLPEKAIVFKDEIVDPQTIVKRPYVVESLCIG